MSTTTTLPTYLMVKKSITHSNSIFATRKINKDHVICTTTLVNLDYADRCITTPEGDVFNHSNTPNVIIVTNPENGYYIDVMALEDIEAGDELLANYKMHLSCKLQSDNEIKINTPEPRWDWNGAWEKRMK